MQDDPVVHIADGELHTTHVFQVVIQEVRNTERHKLADVAAKAHAFPFVLPERFNFLHIACGNCVPHLVSFNDLHGNISDPLIPKRFVKLFIAQPVRNAIEEPFEVVGQDVKVVAPQLLCLFDHGVEALPCERYAFVFHRRAVIIDQASADHWRQGVVTQDALVDSVPDVDRRNDSFFPALADHDFLAGRYGRNHAFSQAFAV